MNAVVELKPGALAQQSNGRMAVADIISHVAMVQEVMRSVMKPDVHYGKIPGTPKPTLYKPGAELLGMTFHIAPSFQTEDLSTADMVRYRVTCVGTHQGTGTVMGEGKGEASSSEEKYKWRKAICDEEFEATPIHLRRDKFGKAQGGGFYKQKQVRTEPADLANTVLKMAVKRAQIAMILNALAASDMFSQDLEDLTAELREELARQGQAGEEAQTEKKAFPDDVFQQGMPAWQKACNKGKTPGEILATVESANPLFQLSEQQKATILSLKPAAQGATDAQVKSEKPAAIGEKSVQSAMDAAKDIDALNEAASQIALVADPAARKRLEGSYDERLAELQGAN
jgi:hypothetical protein